MFPKFLGTVEVDIATILHENPATTNHAPSNPALTGSEPALVFSKQSLDVPSASSQESSSVATTTTAASETVGATPTGESALQTELRRTSTASSLLNPALSSRRSFSVSNLWSRLFADRWQKLQRPSDDSKRCVYLVLQNVTHGLVNPNIMDVKVGTRQHRDTETEAKQKRKVDRCKESTSATLGLRIHGISRYSPGQRKMGLHDKYWGRSLDDAGVFQALKSFVHTEVASPVHVVESIVSRLEFISSCVQNVTWRFWGSSILIVFDPNVEFPRVEVCLIDFGSCDMNAEKKYTGYDDGFVFGLSKLKEGFQKAIISATDDITSPPPTTTTSEE